MVSGFRLLSLAERDSILLDDIEIVFQLYIEVACLSVGLAATAAGEQHELVQKTLLKLRAK